MTAGDLAKAHSVTTIASPPRTAAPVFLDETGRRWRYARRIFLLAGIASTLLAATLVASILVPPPVPQIPIRNGGLSLTPTLVVSKAERMRLAKKLQLWFALQRGHRVPSLRPSRLPLPAPLRGHRGAAGTPDDPIVAGFYVNWDDNSRASLDSNATSLDWVVCEWGFVGPSGDSLAFQIDRRVPYSLAHLIPDPERRPRLFVMVSNYDSRTGKWSPAALAHLVRTPAARAAAIRQIADSLAAYGFAGVTLDFEEVPPGVSEDVARFARALRDRLQPEGRLVTQAVSFNDDDRDLARYAQVDDKLFLMLYDEHYGKRGDPGPVASQRWYIEKARRMLRVIPRRKAILAVGAYGYDWNDADTASNGAGMTFQEVMSAVRDAHDHGQPAAVHFDSTALEPYATWTDPDSTDHLVWYLDAVSMYDQIRAGEALGVAGSAIWRLGSEDPAIWRVLGRHGLQAPPTALATIPPGYDPEFVPKDAQGEILTVVARPTPGSRRVTVDSATHLVVNEQLTQYGTPWIMRRGGESAHRVALTFDDGPDGTWTPQILDTLESRHAPATFFIIGENAERHLPLLRRIYADGNEIGNHTFTHPNLALSSPRIARVEIDATERLIEAALDRRSALFRPPYFGDAEPTTIDELGPVGIASDRGYTTVGLHLDSEDWTTPGVRTIIDTTLAQREAGRGNIILLHDGGGNRAQTVAALGGLIDSLRARGDTLVTVSELMGIPRNRAMPGLPARSRVARTTELLAFGTVGVLEWFFGWVFLTAIALGIARLGFISALAIVQRIKRHQDPSAPITYAPPVSVIVPAYKEEKVIVATVSSLLAQRYPGELEVIVVDDGSPDATYETARAAFGGEPRVRILRKANGGKASALNYGLSLARGEVVICLDADTIFAPNTVGELVEPLHDPRVGAVAGNAKVGNRVNLVTRWQAIEYVTSQNLDRRAFSLLNCITVVPGAVGAWRKALVLDAGGFREDTLAEDQDLTLSIRRAGHRIAYADEAVGYTEAPDSLRTLARQRFRWSFGTLQCLRKHLGAFFRPRYGTLGFVALPSVFLFQIVYPFLSPIADLMFGWSLFSVWSAWNAHGDTYALTSLEQVLTYYAVFLLVDWVATMVGFLLEPGEDKAMTWLVFLQRFAYRQVMYWVVVRSVIAAVRGRVVGWGKLERKATVEVLST